jgi:hypothetical protein
MFTPLITIDITSIYDGGKPLPSRMAHCTPDMHAAAMRTRDRLREKDCDLVLSDMFRSFDMQFQANLDFVTGKKKAFSPPPGGSMHEAGRAFDLDLGRIRKMVLKDFWNLAGGNGLFPIIDKPDKGLSEAWHFDCRGSHQIVYDYYKAKNGDNFKSPYTAMAASGIVSIGQKVIALGDDVRPGYIQSGLIRLGKIIGDLDGKIGPKSRTALEELGIDPDKGLDDIAGAIDQKLQEKFPDEFFVPGPHIADGEPPKHVIG